MPDPLVVQVASQFQRDLEAAEGVQRVLMAQRWRQVEQALDLRIQALSELVIQRQLTMAGILQLAQYRSLQFEVLRELERYSEDIAPKLNGSHAAAARNGARNAHTLTAMVPQEIGSSVDVRLVGLNTRAVENIVSIARAGQPLGDLMARAYGDAATGMLDRLVEGVALGLNPRETARKMRDEGLSLGLNHLELVARDQQIRAYRTAAQQQYQRSGVVRGFRRLAAKSDRTCLACLALDGKVYETGELLELHPQDRCTMVPIVRGFPPVQFQTGREWFETLPAEQQRKMMGPTRHNAWLEGKFDFRDMATRRENNVWGPSAIVTPVSELMV